MIAKATNDARPRGSAPEEHQLVHPCGDDVLLQRQLERVGDGLQQAKGAGRLGPGLFCIRPITRRSNQIMKIVVSSRNMKTIPTLSRPSTR